LDKYAKEIDESVLVLVQMSSVSAISLLFAIFYDGFNPSVFVTGFVPILVIAVFGTAFATLFQAKAQQHASPESVGLLLLGEPLFTLIMAIFILQEPVLLKGLIGAGVILTSLVITVVKKI